MYGKAKLRVESKNKGKRPASMFNPDIRNTMSDTEDYGPLIIDSVVQPVQKRAEKNPGSI